MGYIPPKAPRHPPAGFRFKPEEPRELKRDESEPSDLSLAAALNPMNYLNPAKEWLSPLWRLNPFRLDK